MSRRDQKNIYRGSEESNHVDLSPLHKIANNPIKAERFKPVKIIIASHKFLIALFVAIVFLWAFLGQIFLSPEFRFATFMGERIGDTQAQTTRTALSATVEQANAVANQNSNVQVQSDCVTQLNAQAIGIYNACLQEPNSILAMCEFKRKLTLKQSCEQFRPAPLISINPPAQGVRQ